MSVVSEGPLVSQVVVVPRNGLANRLQAWASAAALAADWDAPLRVVWEPEGAHTADPSDLFSTSLISRSFASPDLVVDLCGKPHESLPRHLNSLGDCIILAGHDQGEQAFMPALQALVDARPGAASVVIIAGGNFHLPGTPDPVLRRSVFYRELSWSSEVTERYRSTSPDGQPFVALHVRQTDRSLEAPTRRALRKALIQLRSSRPERSLFIAADSEEGQRSWTTEAERLGFLPWALPQPSRQRTVATGIIGAAADWLTLSNAQAIVHAAASTFSAEAAVASGHPEESIAVESGHRIQQARRAREFIRSAVTFPARRLRGQRDE